MSGCDLEGRAAIVTGAGRGLDAAIAHALAVIGLTKPAARELARHGVRVNAIAPVARTDMTQPVFNHPRRRAETLSRLPMGRFAEPAEVARSVVFLASDSSSYTTVLVLLADGGLSM